MNYLLRYLPSFTIAVFLLNLFINLDYVLIFLIAALLVVTACSLWIFLKERRQIRLFVRPAKRTSWQEIVSFIFTMVLLITPMVLHFKGLLPEYRRMGFFMVFFPVFGILLQSCAIMMMTYMKNTAMNNSTYYLYGYIFLESGLKKDGVLRKIYPWDHFTAFEVAPQEQAIYLVFRNGNKLTLKINKADFNFQLPAIEMFLREKISEPSTDHPWCACLSP